MMLDKLGINFMELVREGNNFDEIKLCLKQQFPKETKETEDYYELKGNLKDMNTQELRKHFIKIIPKIVDKGLRDRFVSDIKNELFRRFFMDISKKELEKIAELLFPKKLMIILNN